MSLRRVGWFAAMFVAILFWMSCGQVYRPVVIPIENNPPNPANFHEVFGISNNVAPNPGTALQIDVSGDSNIGVANLGANPTHAAILPNNSRIFVASAGSIVNGNADVITAFTPASSSTQAGGIGNPITYTLPNVGPNQSSAITAISEAGNLVTVTLASALGQATVGGPIVISGVVIQGSNVQNPAGYDGNFTITSVSGNTVQYVDPITGLGNASGGTAMIPLPTFCSYQPDFVTTAQSNAVYVANYGQENGPNCDLPSTDSVASLNIATNTIAHIAYLPAGSHPVLLAETPNAQNLYVANQGDGTSPSTVVNLSPVDLSTIATIGIGVNPSWIVSRIDGQRVYVVTQGDGQLYTIRTDTNAVVSTQSVGAGANYILYDRNTSRLYVTSPSTGLLYVFSATGDSPTPLPTPAPNPPGALVIPPVPPCAAAPATCGPVTPVSIAALPDGSRFYVASYQTQSPCSDRYVGPVSCIIPMVTVFDARSLTVRTASSSYFGAELSLLSAPPFGAVDVQNQLAPQYAVPELLACAPVTKYSPGATRFRMFATASADSSHVLVSICDAGAIADISTTTNTVSQGTNADDRLVIDLLAPFSAGPPGVNNQPPPQSPIFLLTGQ
jgi:DNA-binding beta-propeller fold protein YncE